MFLDSPPWSDLLDTSRGTKLSRIKETTRGSSWSTRPIYLQWRLEPRSLAHLSSLICVWLLNTSKNKIKWQSIRRILFPSRIKVHIDVSFVSAVMLSPVGERVYWRTGKSSQLDCTHLIISAIVVTVGLSSLPLWHLDAIGSNESFPRTLWAAGMSWAWGSFVATRVFFVN